MNYTYYYYDSYGRPSSTSNTTGTTNSGGETYTVQITNALNQWISKTSDAAARSYPAAIRV